MLKTLVKQIGEYRFASILTPIWTALEVSMDVLIPYVTASLIDKGITAGDMQNVYFYGTIMLSMAMMKGRKYDLFYLYLSLIGWFLLSHLTLGIGLLWFYPYAQACQHAFYQDVKHDYLMRRNTEKAASEYAPAAPASTTPAPEAPKASENPEDYMPK